jgi:hypothetical protein
MLGLELELLKTVITYAPAVALIAILLLRQDARIDRIQAEILAMLDHCLERLEGSDNDETTDPR